MRFVDRLFPLPLFNQEIFESNLLNGYWISITLLVFLLASGYLIYKYFSIRKNLTIENFQKHKKLEKIWESYKSTFSSYEGVEKTTESSENFFDEHNILFTRMNFRVIDTIPNTLVGLGILGTFVGLTVGIAGSDFQTTEAIKKSIDNLLSGMGTAFITSIWGMGLSIIFTFMFKFFHTDVSRKIDILCISLDREFKISNQDFDKFQEQKQRAIINEMFEEYFVVNVDNIKQLPKNILRQLLDEAVKQTESLQSFSDDLGDSIQKAMEKLLEDNNSNFNLLIEERLIPVLEDLKRIKQDSGTQVIENAVKRLADSMKSMMDDFKTTITGDTKKELEALTERLTKVSESLVNIPYTMTDITLQVAETVEALKEAVIKNIEISKNEVSEQNKNTREAFAVATTEYKSSVEGLQANMKTLLTTQNDNIKQSSELMDKIKITLGENSRINNQFDSLFEKSRVVAQLIENISNRFENNSNLITETSSSLKESITDFNSSINGYINRNNELLDHQSVIMEKAKEAAIFYSERFAAIETGLKGIFDQIQAGLKDYQATTAENLNKYLSEFSNVLTEAHQGLEKNISGLNDITEELNDQIEKLIAKKDA